MNIPALALLIVFVAAACCAVLLGISRRRKNQEELVRRVRSSDLYGHLYPLLLRCNKRCVESVALKPEALAIRLYKPAGRTLVYTFDKHGFDALQPEYLYALAQAVAVDLPLLRDGSRYQFHVRRETGNNGEKISWYEYMITTDYKDSMIRADYL